MEPEMVPISTGLGEIFMFSVEAKPGARQPDGTPYTAEDLRTLSDWVIRPQMRTISGVAALNTTGGYTRQYHVTPTPASLAALYLSHNDVVLALGSNKSNPGPDADQPSGAQHQNS